MYGNGRRVTSSVGPHDRSHLNRTNALVDAFEAEMDSDQDDDKESFPSVTESSEMITLRARLLKEIGKTLVDKIGLISKMTIEFMEAVDKEDEDEEQENNDDDNNDDDDPTTQTGGGEHVSNSAVDIFTEMESEVSVLRRSYQEFGAQLNDLDLEMKDLQHSIENRTNGGGGGAEEEEEDDDGDMDR